MLDVLMPAVVALIICKTAIAGPPDPNAGFTGVENREWVYENSKMVCRRLEVALIDPAELQGAPSVSFTMPECMAAAIRVAVEWDLAHKSSSYRAWRVACPTPIKNYGEDGMKGTKDDKIVGWKLPDCGHRETVTCEVDTEI